MDLTAADEKLLKALAIAIVDHPRATFKEIAQAAGVSKARLNRFCGTRDNLIEMLLNHGSVVIYRSLPMPILRRRPWTHCIVDRRPFDSQELLVFLSFQWRPDTFDLDAGGCRWLPYSETLDEFFSAGKTGRIPYRYRCPGAYRNLS
ncbi:hypothetical protein [Klebsiella pneumoniae]|uniref:hypothetical protein n=1 Tax=Klebsiella pneumoniae TaxID=573 RepID=UPI00296F3E34|nr:hypothetical protein [Klebsiella pneumoniae]